MCKDFVEKKNWYLLLTIVWACVIFSFSLQSGEDSGSLSGGFGQWILDTFFFWCKETIENLSVETLETLHFLLRKCGHFTEFFILGILSGQAVRHLKISRKFIMTFAFCLIVATMDESLQLLVDGRAGRVADVVLDSVGALAGIALLLNLFENP